MILLLFPTSCDSPLPLGTPQPQSQKEKCLKCSDLQGTGSSVEFPIRSRLIQSLQIPSIFSFPSECYSATLIISKFLFFKWYAKEKNQFFLRRYIYESIKPDLDLVLQGRRIINGGTRDNLVALSGPEAFRKNSEASSPRPLRLTLQAHCLMTWFMHTGYFQKQEFSFPKSITTRCLLAMDHIDAVRQY